VTTSWLLIAGRNHQQFTLTTPTSILRNAKQFNTAFLKCQENFYQNTPGLISASRHFALYAYPCHFSESVIEVSSTTSPAEHFNNHDFTHLPTGTGAGTPAPKQPSSAPANFSARIEKAEPREL
jgi:hypothetical protein